MDMGAPREPVLHEEEDEDEEEVEEELFCNGHLFFISAISWCAVSYQPLDVTANGYKQGMTKKAVGTPQAR